ncbi:hypothetical protein Tco_0458295 [Tanacetum coccineum]
MRFLLGANYNNKWKCTTCLINNTGIVHTCHHSPPPNPYPNLSRSSHPFSPLNSLDLEDDEFELLFGEGPSQSVVEESPDESPVKEVAPVKRKYVKRRQPVKKNDKYVNEPSTPEEEGNAVNEKKLRCRSNRIRLRLVNFVRRAIAFKVGTKVELVRILSIKRRKKSIVHFTNRLSNLGMKRLKRLDHSVETRLFVDASSRKEASYEYLRIKERELERQDERRREEVELERLKLAQAEKFEGQRHKRTGNWKCKKKGSSKLDLPDHMYSIYTVKQSLQNWRYKRRCYSLIPAESDSLPHAHAQTTKTYYKHQDSRIKKAQELKTKTSTNSNIKDNSSETKLRGRLLESFQENAKYEHVGQDTRSQGVKDDQDIQGKI